MDYLISNKIISENQSGFVPGRSTSDAVFSLVNTLYHARNRQERSAVVFLDLRKAFDTVDHSILLHKLSQYGVDEESCLWLKDYLTQRMQQTRANNNLSTAEPVTMGVPQGSVLGPLLFITYINNIESVIKHGKTFLYADDLAVVVSGKDPARVKALLQADLDSIGKWCAANKLTVNSEKTQVLWVYSPRSIPNLVGQELTLNGVVLKVVQEFNYLGVKVDTYLSLSSQLKKQIGLMRLRLSQLRRVRMRTDQYTSLWSALRHN